MQIRPATSLDREAVWSIIEPVIREGTTYALPSDLSKEEALAYWFSSGHQVFVAEDAGFVVGTYYLRANQRGGGRHVANCGYMTAQAAQGRGVATAMCQHSLEQARSQGFRAMQFNFVISTNEGAIRLWQKLGFQIVGRLPKAFLHPRLGFVDALVMYQTFDVSDGA
jgi:L-amino acid N-acyltransferase YncA|nr:MAG: GNAT family N-acetyltransferase [Pseudomonadota bacterium]